MSQIALTQSELPGLTPRRGKVRDLYDLGDKLLLVATDRVSAFDWVLPVGIPDKGRLLTQISLHWFETLGEPHHVIESDPRKMPLPQGTDLGPLVGRTILAKKAKVVPIECVVRGYLAGSGWKEYQTDGTVCGIRLPPGLGQSARLPEPIFTPATKAESGHDENISFDRMVQVVGAETALELKRRSLALYTRGAERALERGIIIADTKFEWGWRDGKLILIDEVLTPDSSRFWPIEAYAPGGSPPSYDKQFVRDWLETTSWDKNSPPPKPPAEVIAKTREKYVAAFEILTGRKFAGN